MSRFLFAMEEGRPSPDAAEDGGVNADICMERVRRTFMSLKDA